MSQPFHVLDHASERMDIEGHLETPASVCDAGHGTFSRLQRAPRLSLVNARGRAVN
jgi:hypothetical protein